MVKDGLQGGIGYTRRIGTNSDYPSYKVSFHGISSVIPQATDSIAELSRVNIATIRAIPGSIACGLATIRVYLW